MYLLATKVSSFPFIQGLQDQMNSLHFIYCCFLQVLIQERQYIKQKYGEKTLEIFCDWACI